MSLKDSDTQPASVYKTYEDGYIVRAMTRRDADVVEKWFQGITYISPYELGTVMKTHPRDRGFYVGEYQGQMVASAIRIPWSTTTPQLYYGSFYYVDENFRGRGFGTRLRDEVAVEHMGQSSILIIDAVSGTVTRKNLEKFGYVAAWNVIRLKVVAKDSYGVTLQSGNILPASDVNFEKMIEYDSKCFIVKNSPIRREFMKQWTQIPGGASYVAVDTDGVIVGLGCRRPAFDLGKHCLGPIYADSANIAEALLQKLCQDVPGEILTIDIWEPNEGAVSMVKKFAFETMFSLVRMHLNGDPKDYKDTVYACTSVCVCGF